MRNRENYYIVACKHLNGTNTKKKYYFWFNEKIGCPFINSYLMNEDKQLMKCCNVYRAINREESPTKEIVDIVRFSRWEKLKEKERKEENKEIVELKKRMVELQAECSSIQRKLRDLANC